MPNHDRYETDILKTLQRIANALERIDLTLRDNNSEKNERNTKETKDFCKTCAVSGIDAFTRGVETLSKIYDDK